MVVVDYVIRCECAPSSGSTLPPSSSGKPEPLRVIQRARSDDDRNQLPVSEADPRKPSPTDRGRRGSRRCRSGSTRRSRSRVVELRTPQIDKRIHGIGASLFPFRRAARDSKVLIDMRLSG